MSANLVEQFREGWDAMRSDLSFDRRGKPATACPYLATSPNAYAWHAGYAYSLQDHTPLNGGEILVARMGRGDLFNVWLGGGRQLAAEVSWDAGAATVGRFRECRSSLSAAAISRLHALELAKRPDVAERNRQIIELAAKAPLQSKGRPVADVGHLPLFVAANEPELFA
jgi:hypothetical protein